jgi:hypothetical protein
MTKIAILLSLALAASLLAGCATNSTPSTPSSGTTPSTMTPSSPTGMTPSTMTPEMTAPIPTYSGPAVTDLWYNVTQTQPGPNVTYMYVDGPNLTNPGWVTFHLGNKGFEPHQLVVVKLGGETFQEHMAMMMSAMMPANGTAGNGTMMNESYKDVYVGGIGNVLPGGTDNATVHLAPGRYVIECEIPGPAGPHFAHGMIMELDVSGADNGAPEPTADLTLSLKEFSFNWSATPTAGHHEIKVVNVGTMPHEAPMERLVGNHTMQDFFAWVQNPQGAPPVDQALGAGGIDPGQVEYVDANFEAGHTYGAACFFPDANGAPHFTHGMVTQWSV